jgi:hypothetical protein
VQATTRMEMLPVAMGRISQQRKRKRKRNGRAVMRSSRIPHPATQVRLNQCCSAPCPALSCVPHLPPLCLLLSALI